MISQNRRLTMKDNQAKYPQLRFKGFTDPWEERKLGEVATLSSSKRIHLSDYVTEGIPFYRGSEISTGGITGNQELFISQEKFDEIKEKYGVPSEGDILVTAVGTLGNLWKVDSRRFYYKDGNLIQISKMQVNSDYLLTYFTGGMGKKRLLDSAAGSNQKALTMVKMREITVDFPSEDEQKKIGAFFKQLDHLITLHQRKLAKLKELKQGYLQKLFPKNGAKVPELRFAGFADAWEERKLGDAVSISSGVTGDATLQDGEYRLTRIESISQGMLNVARLGFTNEKPDQKYLLNLGDILYSNINSLSHIGKVALVDTAGIYHGINLLRFQMRNDVDSEFLFQRLNTMPMKSWAVSHANPAVSQASINQTELSKQPISSPTITEQQKIGSFFKQLDDTIALHQRKLEKLQELKKGYLQKMFC